MTIQFLPTKVYHKRFLPKTHILNHDIFYYMIDLDALDDIHNYAISAYNKFHVWSIYSKDYGFDGDGLNPKRFDEIRQHYHIPQGKTYLVTTPRFLGHSFNPVSFFLFYDAQKRLRAVLSEVHNTFKERHCYISQHCDGREILSNDVMRAKKIFHVSPFFPVLGFYHFQFHDTNKRLMIKIDYYNQEGQKTLATGIQATKEKLKKTKPLMLAIRYPFISIKILLLIHYHAVLLWLKKIRFFKKPPPPSQPISS
ncbi:MAG: DUF1365 family protein [Alphaproteobacteria bacterium]|jgi:DUF1365 family protein